MKNNFEKQLIIIRGGTSTGKTSISKYIQNKYIESNIAILCPDYFYYDVVPDSRGKNLVYENLKLLVENYLKNDYSVILEGLLTKLYEKYPKQIWEEIAKEYNTKVKFIYLDMDINEALKRHHDTNKNVTDEQATEWHKYNKVSIQPFEKVIDVTTLSLEEIENEII